jgi:16S rRNA (guanine966-N2)-methyltransferase
VRVIAGSARGVRLARVPAGTRPLSDRAREGLFSSLGEAVHGGRWADLFAGTGAVGIEALSRGAISCMFVDQSAAAVRTIRDNLLRTGTDARATVVRAEVRRYLQRARDARFDLVFLDPPYRFAASALRRVLQAAADRLDRGGTLVLTRPAGDNTDVIPLHWAIVRRLAYGDARVLVCREGP